MVGAKVYSLHGEKENYEFYLESVAMYYTVRVCFNVVDQCVQCYMHVEPFVSDNV